MATKSNKRNTRFSQKAKRNGGVAAFVRNWIKKNNIQHFGTPRIITGGHNKNDSKFLGVNSTDLR